MSTVSVPAVVTGRFAISTVHPANLDGRRPAVAVVGERIPVRATILREGHEPLRAGVRWSGPSGSGAASLIPQHDGLDTYVGEIRFEVEGDHQFTIEAWADPWQIWVHRIQAKGEDDLELECQTGAALLQAAAKRIGRGPDAAAVRTAAKTLTQRELPGAVRIAAATDPALAHIMAEHASRDLFAESGPWPIRVQRRRALVGSWYEFFPRSEGATASTGGTFSTARHRLPAIADMGFDVVYLPPIHPIGTSHRKGRNNSVVCAAGDPGSPWAIGSPAGGHDSVHPELGTMADFDDFVAHATQLGLDIALDLALQASPDHPWVHEHPEWFSTRVDGSIAYAENPPKKYQDIYPLNFDNDPEGLYQEVERIVRLWISHGVQIFRVDNPHTKPLWVWERLIASINTDHPDVIFLAEAFTRPAMMHALAQIGFQQSYTYFTWRNDAASLRRYCEELSGPAADYMRPNFFVNTPDILSEYLQTGGPPAFAIRATLAACLSPTYGIYSGFELYEHVAVRPGSEEYLDSEKYQLRPRDWDSARTQHRTLAPYLTFLNTIRREHPALQDLRSLHFHHSDNPNLLAFTKHDHDDVIAVVCTVDPHHQQSGSIHWDMHALGLAPDASFIAHDLVTDSTWTWQRDTYVELRPWQNVAHIAHIPMAN
jgi:starch synthase (maltosyl-transferring)